MEDILNQAGNILNSGGGKGTILWFSIALIATIVYVCSKRQIIKGAVIASYICLITSFFDIGITFQTVLFAVVIIVFGMISGGNRKGTKQDG